MPEIPRSQSLSRPSERSNLERRRSLPEFSSDRGENRNLFTQFNSGLPDVYDNRPGERTGNVTVQTNEQRAGDVTVQTNEQITGDVTAQTNEQRAGDVTVQTNERRKSLFANFPSRSELQELAQTDNPGGTGMITGLSNRLSWIFSEFRIQTDNSDGTGIPTELKNRLDQLFFGSHELRTIDRPELQGLPRHRMIDKVQNVFKDLSKAHKTKILDTSRVFSLNEIGQILQEGLRLLEDGKFILNTSITTLEQTDGRIQNIVNREVQDDIDAWKKMYRNAREPEPGIPYYDINVAKSKKIHLEVIINALPEEKDPINFAIQDFAFYTFPTAGDYSTLRSNTEETYTDTVKVPILQYIDSLRNQIEEVNFPDLTQKAYDMASQQIDKINALIEVKKSEWVLANALYENLEQWKPGHPFFLEGDMLDAAVTITVPPREYFPGRGLVHMVSTILSAQGFKVTEGAQDYMKQVLGQHPYGGGVSVKHLDSRFTEIESQTKYQFRKIELKDLKIALSTGKPIGAFLDTSQVDVTSRENYYPEHTVTLVMEVN